MLLWFDRKVGESIVIDGHIRVTVEKIKTDQVKDKDCVSISIDAPREIPIVRSELGYADHWKPPSTMD